MRFCRDQTRLFSWRWSVSQKRDGEHTDRIKQLAVLELWVTEGLIHAGVWLIVDQEQNLFDCFGPPVPRFLLQFPAPQPYWWVNTRCQS